MNEKLSDILNKLSPERRMLLARRLNVKNVAVSSSQPSSRTNSTLTQAQSPAVAPQNSLVAIQPTGNRPPFFCVHPAGGHVFCYMELARRLGSEQPFYGFQSRDFDKSAVTRRSIEAMASLYVATMLKHQPAGPYSMGGWSMGGVVAFEMARQLDSQGHKVASLILLDARIPTAEQRLETDDEVSLIIGFASDLGVSLGRLGVAWHNVRQLQPDERLAFVLREAKTAGVVPDDIQLGEVETLFETFKENARAMCDYTPRPYRGLLTLFVAEESSPGADDLATSWDEWTGAEVEVFRTPGNHYTMTRDPHVRFLAEQLNACLKRIE